MQEIAFNRAVDLYGYAPSIAQPPITTPSPARGSGDASGTSNSSVASGSSTGASSGSAKTEAAFYETMSNATGISTEALLRFIDIHDDAPRIALKTSQLPSVTSKAQKVVSLLIILARHYYNDENEIELAICSEECKRLSCIDQNLKRNLGLIPDLMLTGTGTNTKAKVREPLVKSSAETLRKLGVNVD
ncbi:hypothetical protein ACWDTP_19315 [Mycobacterium sp. NPDC003449]